MDGVTTIDDGPSHPWKSRNCLSFGECTRSWSLNGTWRTISRRLCMWTIIILRTVMNILAVAFSTLGSKVVSIVCGALVGIISFMVVFWCLTMIDRAHGSRTCPLCGLVVGRTHLDILLGITAFLHIGLLAAFWSIVIHSAAGFNIIWFALWILIVVYGFICTKTPESA